MPNKTLTYCIAISVLSVALIIGGCSEMLRPGSTEFELTKIQKSHQYFKYKAEAVSGIFQPDNKSAEKERMQWLKKWLAINGYENAEYEIVSRQVVLEFTDLVGSKHYRIYYEGKVKLSKRINE